MMGMTTRPYVVQLEQKIAQLEGAVGQVSMASSNNTNSNIK